MAGGLVILGVWLLWGTGLHALAPQAWRSGPGGLALLLLAVAGLLPGLWLAMRLVHGRQPSRLIAPDGRFDTGQALAGAGLGIAVYLVALLGGFALAGVPPRSPLPLGDWALWLLPLCGLIAVQAAAEELLFRGYLLQGLRRRFAHPAVWAGLPSILFGALHYDPALPGLSGLLYALVSGLFGLAAALLVWRSDGLSAAIGLHGAVNVGALLVAGLSGPTSGALLWRYPVAASERLLASDLVAVAALLALAMLWPLRRRVVPA